MATAQPRRQPRQARDELLTIGETAARAGLPTSTLRFWESRGLIASTRTAGNQRRYARHVLRRLAFIRAARSVGISLDEIRTALGRLPTSRAPTQAEWSRLSQGWRRRLEEQLEGLTSLRDQLSECIGCGCLSLRRCTLMNPGDVLAATGAGARELPASLRSARS